MGRGGGGGGGGSFGGGGFSGGGGGHIGGGFSGGRVGGSSHSSGSSWGGSHSSGGSGWSGSRSNSGWGSSGYSSGSGYRNYNSGGSGLFPPLWWWIWGGGSTRNNSYNDLNRQKYNNNNNNGGQDPKKKEPEKKEPEKKKSSTVGCLSVILILVAIILAFVMIAGISSAKNAKNRTKLDKKITVDIGYLDDELGWIDNKSLVEKSMKGFYDQTGVMPYLIITDNIGSVDPQSESQTQALAQSVYNSLFGSDDAHFLVLWYQRNGNDDYAFMYSGTSANGVIDADARKVVMNYFNRYYTSDYDDSHYFAKVFEDSAEEIMLQADTGWKTTLLLLVLVIGVLIAMNVIDYKNTMKIKKQEAAAKILNANIEDPGWKDEAETLSEKYSDEASELASKYEDKK